MNNYTLSVILAEEGKGEWTGEVGQPSYILYRKINNVTSIAA